MTELPFSQQSSGHARLLSQLMMSLAVWLPWYLNHKSENSKMQRKESRKAKDTSGVIEDSVL